MVTWFAKVRVTTLLTGVLFVAGFLYLLSHLNPFANDDVFVYYNYARNMVEGRPFAYDVRNIPSEGFTSLLYLLMLVPFEFFGLNMTFSSVLINLSALITTIGMASYLSFKSGVLSKNTAIVFFGLVWTLIIFDQNVSQIIGWGLESMLGPLVLVLTGYALWMGCEPDKKLAHRGLLFFLIMLFVSYLTRPESIFFIGVSGGILFFTGKIDPRKIFRYGLIFVVLFVAYHLVKYMIFDDIFPTGFYRKIGEGDGLNYVQNWAIAYRVQLISCLLLLLANGLYMAYTKQWLFFQQRWLWMWLSASVLTVMFFTRTEPLIGVGYRFLISPIIILYIVITLLAICLFNGLTSRLAGARYLKGIVNILAPMLAIYYVGSSWWQATADTDRIASMNVYDRAVESTNAHIYLQIGEYFNEALSNPKDITFVFGDAGALPYALDSRFIDTNGLTEPTIARLFKLPDGKTKTRKYVDYILSQDPDLVVLGIGKTDKNTGAVRLSKNTHSPFNGVLPIQLWLGYSSIGIRYVCSIRSYYDLHMGVRADSPYATEIGAALLQYCRTNGYILRQGLTIQSQYGESVSFPELQNWSAVDS